MADMGRFGVAAALKRLLDLSGNYEPALGEGIVPVIQLADLERTPFSVTIPWCRRISQAGLAVNYPYIVLQPGPSLPLNAWISVDQIFLGEMGAGTSVSINPVILTNLPTITSQVLELGICMRQPAYPTTQRWLIGELNFLQGSSVTLQNTDGLGAQAGTSSPLEGAWAITQGGGLSVSNPLIGASLTISMTGRIHLTTAK